MRLISLIILRLEPRASLLATVHGVHHGSSGYRGEGGIPRVVQGWYVGRLVYHHSTPWVCREAGIPTMVHPEV